MSEERAVRERIVAVARRLDAKGILTATDGNLSVRLEDGTLLITPSGSCKGLITVDDLVHVSPDGTPLSGGRASSEIALHRTLYRQPEVRAVVHAHPPHATAYAVAGISLDRAILSEAVLTLGEVDVAPYATPTGPELAASIEPHVAGRRAVLLRFHGAVTFGASIEQAGFLMETLEHVAQIDTIRRMLGSDAMLDEEQVAALRALKTRLGL